jgi:hypothetical protein
MRTRALAILLVTALAAAGLPVRSVLCAGRTGEIDAAAGPAAPTHEAAPTRETSRADARGPARETGSSACGCCLPKPAAAPEPCCCGPDSASAAPAPCRINCCGDEGPAAVRDHPPVPSDRPAGPAAADEPASRGLSAGADRRPDSRRAPPSPPPPRAIA